jgi:hypothetical protein
VASLAVALACVTAGCGAVGPQSRTFVGPVTVVTRDRVCVGGAGASGECFLRDWMTRGLGVSDCVRVTYTPDDSAPYSTGTKVDTLDAAGHADACPHQ